MRVPRFSFPVGWVLVPGAPAGNTAGGPQLSSLRELHRGGRKSCEQAPRQGPSPHRGCSRCPHAILASAPGGLRGEAALALLAEELLRCPCSVHTVCVMLDMCSLTTPLPCLLVWVESFLSCWNGRTVDCHPKSASTWGCHCNSPRQERGERGEARGLQTQQHHGIHCACLPPPLSQPRAARAHWAMASEIQVLVPALLPTSSFLICKTGLISPAILALGTHGEHHGRA